MSEIKDMVMPVLQRLQADTAEFRRETKSVLSDHSAKFNELGEKFDALSGYITYQMGMTTQGQSDIQELQKQYKDLAKRVGKLESGH